MPRIEILIKDIFILYFRNYVYRILIPQIIRLLYFRLKLAFTPTNYVVFPGYTVQMSNLGERLSQDEWLVLNTLPFVFHFLDTPDILRCGMVCKLWYQIISNLSLCRTITLRNCKVKWDQLIAVMLKFHTRNLKLVKCLNLSGRTKFVGFHHLHTLVISDLNSNLLENLAENCFILRVLHTNVICSHNNVVLDLSCICKMKCLEDLKIYCNRKIENETTLIERLSLKHMWLLEVQNLNMDANNWMGRAEKTESSLVSLGIGNCERIPKSCLPFSAIMPLLTTICLCNCVSWSPPDFFQNLSTLKNLNSLMLIDFTIKENFEEGLKLCTNLNTLTIIPSASRFHMGLYNGRIFRGVTQMQLKTLKWGFTASYMKHCFHMFDVPNVVPVSYEGISGHCLVTPKELQAQLKEILLNTEVLVVENISVKEFRGF